VDPQSRGPDWMPITPKTGSLFHAESQPGATSRSAPCWSATIRAGATPSRSKPRLSGINTNDIKGNGHAASSGVTLGVTFLRGPIAARLPRPDSLAQHVALLQTIGCADRDPTGRRPVPSCGADFEALAAPRGRIVQLLSPAPGAQPFVVSALSVPEKA
jgi:hypothetical protein